MDRNYFQKSWRYCQSAAAAAAKSLQSCPTLCNPIDGSPPGSAIPGILQARTLEWVAISFSKAWQWKVKGKSLSKCPTLSDPMDCSLPGSSSHGIFQARVLEWGAIAFPESYCYPRINGNGDWISPQGIQNVLTILANIYLEVLSQMCLGKFPLKLWINRLERTEGLSK